MCVIIYHQRKHKTIPLKELQNAIHNNPHGVGLVRYGTDKKLIVERYLPEDLENGPNAEELHKKLTKLDNFSYALHLRNTTAGSNTEQNLHPFNLINDAQTEQHVEFMHNGTLGEYVDTKSDKSDTLNFVESFARPLTEFHVAAYPTSCIVNNTLVMNYFEKIRNHGSRFLIISGHRNVMRMGNWVEKEFGFVSNDDYFREVTRGPNKKKWDHDYSTGAAGYNRVFSNSSYTQSELEAPGSGNSIQFFRDNPYFSTFTPVTKKEPTYDTTFFK